ncbi:MAG: pre-toxin TG domain-containing protein [Desulfobacula sp.]
MAVRLIAIYFLTLLCCPQLVAAADEPHVVYRYETHSSDRVTHYLDVVRLKSFEEKLPALRAGESYKNIEVIFRGHTENECLDWLCPQVEQIWVDWVSINWRGKFDQYVFLGKQYSRDAPRFPCEYFGKDYPVSTPQATDAVPPPPEITGSVAECLRSKGLSPSTGSRNAYADDSRAHEWQENFNQDWDEAAMGSQAFQARMRHSGHIYVDSLGWVESGVMSKEIQDCTSRQMEAGIRRLAGLMGGDASDREIMALRLAAAMADPDPATRMAKLERLRSGIFSLIMAENYMAQKEQAEVDAVGAFVEPAATISNIVSTFAPGLNDSRDAYEAWKGKDSFSDQPLEWWERALSVAGLVVGSGKLYREAAAKLFGRVAKLPVETVGGKPWKIIKSSTLSPEKRSLLDRALAGKGKLPSELAGAVPDL